MNGWFTVRAGEAIHITPANDLRPHELIADCWCDPEINLDLETQGAVISHNSLDGREDYETGYRKPS